jgi:hypothetical protein
MFVQNKTRLSAALARAEIADDTTIAALVVESSYRVEGGKLRRIEEPRERLPTDPPEHLREPIWPEVAVTASGSVLGPVQAPFVRPVAITVGREVRRLIVSGERRWRRGAGDLAPSEPARFDALPLAWSRAFGGTIDVEPGLDPSSGLPHPGGKLSHPSNPLGIGLYLDERSARDRELPNIEDPAQRMERWDDRPEPACFAPCLELPALRAPRIPAASGILPSQEQLAKILARLDADRFSIAYRMRCHAPPSLIFESLPPGTPIRLEGVGRRPIGLEVPSSPVRVAARRGLDRTELGAHLRSLHIDADAAVVTAVHAHGFRHTAARAPEWLVVTAVSA